MTIPGRIEGGRLIPNPIRLEAWIAKHGEGPVEIDLRPAGESKTLRQLRFIHGPVTGAISEALGYPKRDVKAWLKANFGVTYEYADLLTGEVRTEAKSFGDYTKAEMRQFLDDVVLWAGTLDIHLPVPDDLR